MSLFAASSKRRERKNIFCQQLRALAAQLLSAYISKRFIQKFLIVFAEKKNALNFRTCRPRSDRLQRRSGIVSVQRTRRAHLPLGCARRKFAPLFGFLNAFLQPYNTILKSLSEQQSQKLNETLEANRNFAKGTIKAALRQFVSSLPDAAKLQATRKARMSDAIDGVFVAGGRRCRASEHRLDASGRRKEGRDAESGGSRALRMF